MKPYVKMIIIAAIVVVAGLLVYFIWTWLTSAPAAPNQAASAPYFPLAGLTSTGEATSTGGTAAPAMPVGALTKISDKPASFFWTDPATGEIFYLDTKGVVWQAEAGQKNPQITQQGVAAVNFIQQSPDGEFILAAFGDPSAQSWGIYDVVDQVWSPLPGNILQATWGADSHTLIATETSGSRVDLVSLDVSQNPPKTKMIAADFNFLDARFSFLPPSTLLIIERGSASYGGHIWGMNIKTATLNLLLGPANGLTARLTSDGSTMVVYAAASGFQILNSQTLQNLAPLPFLTLPQKCSINSGTTVYCFVPTNPDFKSATLPDDYFDRKIYTTDVLYGINTQTGASTLIPLPQNALGGLDAEKPALAGQTLYFIDRLNGYLYALNLGA